MNLITQRCSVSLLIKIVAFPHIIKVAYLQFAPPNRIRVPTYLQLALRISTLQTSRLLDPYAIITPRCLPSALERLQQSCLIDSCTLSFESIETIMASLRRLERAAINLRRHQ